MYYEKENSIPFFFFFFVCVCFFTLNGNFNVAKTYRLPGVTVKFYVNYQLNTELVKIAEKLLMESGK